MSSRDIKLINNDYLGILKAVAGAKIVGVEYLAHYFDHVEPNIIAVQINFSGLPEVIIKCGNDGESLEVIYGVLEKIDLGEFGRIEVVDSNRFDSTSLSACVNTFLKRVTLKVSGSLLKAIQMECEGRKAFFSNVGDTLNFSETRFRKMLAEERWGILTEISYPLEELDN